jgi:hypothetical protein
MFDDSWETNIQLDRLEKNRSELQVYMIDKTAERLVEVTLDFTEGGITDWSEAIHEEGPDGEHSLLAVEAEIVEIMQSRNALVDVMRNSVEWDEELYSDDAQRAARALVNESLEQAEALWLERLESAPEV